VVPKSVLALLFTAIQTTDDEDPTFVSAAQEILDGFQMLAPTS
jgi:hypothetical protein